MDSKTEETLQDTFERLGILSDELKDPLQENGFQAALSAFKEWEETKDPDICQYVAEDIVSDPPDIRSISLSREMDLRKHLVSLESMANQQDSWDKAEGIRDAVYYIINWLNSQPEIDSEEKMNYVDEISKKETSTDADSKETKKGINNMGKSDEKESNEEEGVLIDCPKCHKKLNKKELSEALKRKNELGIPVLVCPSCGIIFKINPYEYFESKKKLENGVVESSLTLEGVAEDELLEPERQALNYENKNSGCLKFIFIPVFAIAAIYPFQYVLN